MNRVAAKIEAEIWAPPTPSAGRKGNRWQRMTAIGVVAGLHLLLLAMCAVRPLVIGDGQAPDAKTIVYVTSELTPPGPVPLHPPRLIGSSVTDAADFARRAGIAPGESARVVLSIRLSASGAANDIKVATGSGNPRVDALAIEYARALRWRQATGQAPNPVEEIRVPVVLASPGGKTAGPH